MKGSTERASGELFGTSLGHRGGARTVEQLHGFAKEVGAPATGIEKDQGCIWPDARKDQTRDPTATAKIEHPGRRGSLDRSPSAGETEAVVYMGGQGSRPEEAQFTGTPEDLIEPGSVGLAELYDLICHRWPSCRLFSPEVSLHRRL